MESTPTTAAVNSIFLALNRELHVLSTSPRPIATKDELGYFEEQLSLALSTVRTLRNASVSAINRLPQEVLALVPTHFDRGTLRATLDASQVCRYWRSAIISSPALWNVMDTTRMGPYLWQLSLERSKASPLEVTLGVGIHDRILQQLVASAPRVRLLSFARIPWHRWKEIAERFSDSPLPALSHLQFFAVTQGNSTAPDPPPFTHAFNLRHLFIQISGPSAPIWSHISFPGLTSIRIEFEGKREPITMLGQLLGVLRSSPLLEDVQLGLRILTAEPGVSHRPVPLLRLRKLIISSEPTPILLTSILFPPTACVLARITGDGSSIHNPMSPLGQHLSPLVSGSDELIFSFSDISLLSTVHFKRDGETRVKFEHYGSNHPTSLEQTLAFATECPLDAVRRFVIAGIRRREANDQISQTMRNLTSAKTLVLKDSRHSISLLRPEVQDGQLPCPVLETLAIDDDQNATHRKLVRVARARAEAGSPLPRIISRAKYPKELAGKLRRFVGSVEHGEDVDFRS